MEKEKDLSLFHIPEIKEDCRFWMIRTKDGMFFEEYIKKGFIAIGWNPITKNDFPLHADRKLLLEQELKDRYGSQAPGSAISKCEKFCMEIQPGDFAVITGREQVAFAEIGEYFEEDGKVYNEALEQKTNEQIASLSYEPESEETSQDTQELFLDPLTGQSSFFDTSAELSAQKPKKEPVPCPYCKRRKIKLLSLVQDRNTINPYLYKAILLNKHSLSSLDKYADSILSACYDLYLWGGTLSFALKVDTLKKINAVTLSKFIHSFTELLPTIREEDMSVKTSLHSPGDIVFQIAGWLSDAGNSLWVFLILMFLFGGKFKDTEFPSLWNVAKYFIERHDQRETRRLQEENMELQNDLLREQIASLQLDNRRKEELERSANVLAKAAQDLEIRPAQGNIIDIKKILSDMQSQEEKPSR